MVCLGAALVFGGCVTPPSAATPTSSPPAVFTPSLTPSLTFTPSPTPIPPESLPVWSTYPAPRFTPSTPVPPPFGRVALPEGMHTLLLVGQDQFSPYLGRSDALLLVFYHPRLAKASLVSIPPDLFGYLPGYTMQRLSSAYAAGGIRLLTGAVEYNLGVRPDDWLVANMDDFILFIDELGGVTVPVMQAVPNACGDFIYPGEVFMEGWLAACYARLRVGTDEASRGLRQQQLLFIVLQRLAGGGNLIRLPELYQLFNRRVRTSLTLEDLLANGSLMLRLADPKRVGFFQMGEGETEVWQISEQPPATVFLPRRPAILKLLERAIDFASKPAPFSDLVVTLEYELTVSPTPTLSPTPTPTFTETLTPTFLPTETPTPTGSATPGASPTPSVTLSPTP